MNDTAPSSPVDPTIKSLTDLIAVPTAGLLPPIIKIWVNYADGTSNTDMLLGIDGGTRPADFNTLEPKSWFRASS